MKFGEFAVQPGAESLEVGSYFGMLISMIPEKAPSNWNQIPGTPRVDYVFRFTFLVWDDMQNLGNMADAIELTTLKSARLTQRSHPYKWLVAIFGKELPMKTGVEQINNALPRYCQVQIVPKEGTDFTMIGNVMGLQKGQTTPAIPDDIRERYPLPDWNSEVKEGNGNGNGGPPPMEGPAAIGR